MYRWMALLWVFGCGEDPATEVADTGRCGTSGAACIELRYSLGDGVRERLGDDAVGRVHWALYHAEDVAPFAGPGDSEPLHSGNSEEPVDLSDAGADYRVVVPDVPAGDYEALGFQDLDGSGDSNSGEPVTFPGIGGGFEVEAGVLSVVALELDTIRP